VPIFQHNRYAPIFTPFVSTRLAHVRVLMNNFTFFEYRAKITGISHGDEAGERVHCVFKMRVAADHGHHCRDEVELKQDVGDMILFALKPGPFRKVSHSEVWKVNANRITELGEPSNLARLGDSIIYFYAS
jgi:hypothetical protein